ncbi:MAG: hypothetical protein LBU10_06200, partial [Endomicrobium sp.]|nr:hypothetical protein [Endomicrobium sp.]
MWKDRYAILQANIEEQYIGAYSVKELIERKRYESSNSPIQIKYKPDENNKFVFMKGDSTDFSRMMSNLINNGVDAVEEKG